MASNSVQPARIAIGGIGGSGTRVIAAIVRDLGYCFGPDLNGPLDNLWFTRLLANRMAPWCDDETIAKRYDAFRSAMTVYARATNVASAMVYRQLTAENLGGSVCAGAYEDFRSEALAPDSTIRWGWKEPKTHMCIDRILNIDPDLYYFHVVRNGLDMAYSKNQTQLRIWGQDVLGDKFEQSPRGSLRFWCWAHRRILALARSMPSRCILVDFDELCRAPDHEIGKILDRLNIAASTTLLDDLAKRVVPPASVGRHKAYSSTDFDAEDIDFVGQLGFPVYETA